MTEQDGMEFRWPFGGSRGTADIFLDGRLWARIRHYFQFASDELIASRPAISPSLQGRWVS